MALKPSIKTIGKLQVTIYYFEFAGDILPVHTHTEETNHITIVNMGSFKCISDDPDVKDKIITQGQVIDWLPNVPHGFIALDDDSRMIQIAK